jgi:lactoylglutathione lyase
MNGIAQAFSGGLFAVTLLVEDLTATDRFYGQRLGLTKAFSDEVSSVYLAGSTAINLLLASEGDELITPAKIGTANLGVQAVYTLRVNDVDSVADQLRAAGVELLNGPIDRPWGVRTASFADPSGHVWEIANHQ